MPVVVGWLCDDHDDYVMVTVLTMIIVCLVIDFI